MTTRFGPTVPVYAMAGTVGVVFALAVGNPDAAVVGGVLLALGLVGLAGGGLELEVDVEIDGVPESGVEGQTVEFQVSVRCRPRLGHVDVDLNLSGMEVVAVEGARWVGGSALSLSTGGAGPIKVTARLVGWGRARVGPVTVGVDSMLGLVEGLHEAPVTSRVLVMPDAESLRTILSPLETTLHVGDLVSRLRGPGSEFADLRLYRHGDDPRSVNWRVSSRSQALWVNERHPERNGDVLLLVDAQVETGTGLESMVDRAIRMAAALLQRYWRSHHRVGLVTLDGLCRWIEPGMGEAHRRRIMQQLLGVAPGEVIWDTAGRAVNRVARPPALVVTLTPLVDTGLTGLVHSLRRRGVDVVVVEVDVEALLPEPANQVRSLGRRTWAMDRDRLRDRLAGDGIAVVPWRVGDPPEVPIAHISQWRTSWRRRLG